MASDVMSLFGLNPNMIQQDRLRDAGDAAARMNPYYAAGRAGGMLMGAGAGSALGLQTAEMQEASNVKNALQGVDLETPEGLRQAATQLSASGDYGRAIALVSAANQLEAEQLSVTRDEETRMLGKTSNVVVSPASFDNLSQKSIPAVVHSITEYYDGTVLNNTTGQKYGSRAEMAEALRQVSNGTEKTEDTIRTPEEVLKIAATVPSLNAKIKNIEAEINRFNLQYGNTPNIDYYQKGMLELNTELEEAKSQLKAMEDKLGK